MLEDAASKAVDVTCAVGGEVVWVKATVADRRQDNANERPRVDNAEVGNTAMLHGCLRQNVGSSDVEQEARESDNMESRTKGSQKRGPSPSQITWVVFRGMRWPASSHNSIAPCCDG